MKIIRIGMITIRLIMRQIFRIINKKNKKSERRERRRIKNTKTNNKT